jgi:hypothetical protein
MALKLALLDYTRLPHVPTTLQRYQISVAGAKAAKVVGAATAEHRRDPFGVLVARNKGLHVNVFTDRDPAVQWLLLEHFPLGSLLIAPRPSSRRPSAVDLDEVPAPRVTGIRLHRSAGAWRPSTAGGGPSSPTAGARSPRPGSPARQPPSCDGATSE